jgi:hypothetical protein
VILAAGFLVLTGLGLFLAGVLTGTTAFYWACVAVCVLAGGLLFAARRRISRAEAAGRASTAVPPPSGSPDGKRTAPEPVEREPASGQPAGHDRASAGRAARRRPDAPSSDRGDPPVEEAEFTDLLLVVDLKDEVLVIDEHPRYHLAGCRHLRGRTAIPVPLDEARADGFTPCAACAPDRHLADQVRARRHAAGG